MTMGVWHWYVWRPALPAAAAAATRWQQWRRQAAETTLLPNIYTTYIRQKLTDKSPPGPTHAQTRRHFFLFFLRLFLARRLCVRGTGHQQYRGPPVILGLAGDAAWAWSMFDTRHCVESVALFRIHVLNYRGGRYPWLRLWYMYKSGDLCSSPCGCRGL